MSSQDELFYVRGMIASLPKEQQQLVNDAAGQIRGVITSLGEVGPVALALIAMEFAAAD